MRVEPLMKSRPLWGSLRRKRGFSHRGFINGFFSSIYFTASRTPHDSKNLHGLRGIEHQIPMAGTRELLKRPSPCDAPARPSSESKKDIQSSVLIQR
jgi:hypothetical protein